MSSVARITEIIASSKKGFDDALENGKITEYRVRLKVTFVLAE
jgi:flavin-binding protein dodecin